MKKREKALKWWKNLDENPILTNVKQKELADVYYPNRIVSSLTGREIENIFDFEVNKSYLDLKMYFDFSEGVSLSDDEMKRFIKDAIHRVIKKSQTNSEWGEWFATTSIGNFKVFVEMYEGENKYNIEVSVTTNYKHDSIDLKL
jgi:hypothetical protein